MSGGEKKLKIDPVDVELLRTLQSNARTSNAELARMVQLTPPSVLVRVRKLEESGLIKGYRAILDAEKLGYSLIIFVNVSLSLSDVTPIEKVRKSISTVPEVCECYHVSGDYDFLLKVLVQDMSHYEALVRETLSKIPGVSKLQSCFVLHQAKGEHEISI